MPSPFDITSTEAATFMEGRYRFTEIHGPQRLARFSDSRKGADGRLGRFWLYGQELSELLSSGPAAKSLIKRVSQRWAVCDDWGDKELMWLMNVPRGHAVPACWGAAKFQPKVSAKTQDKGGRQTRHSYEGGSLQLIIPVSDTDKRPNEFLVSLITGPFPTDLVATHPKRFI